MIRTLISLAVLFTASITIAQQPLLLGVTDQIRSATLSETRTLNIYLPEGYHPDSAYPVIYLLDGSLDEDFIHITGLVQFLSFPWINKVPRSIVVGIANVNRKRDFTHPSTDSLDRVYVPGSGGSARFMTFIGQELQPYIDSIYRTTPQKTLIGQSLGGLFATEVLLRKPELFTHYVIISPSLWWNKSSLLKEVPTFLKTHPALSQQVFLAIGNEGKEMNAPMNKLVAAFKKNAPKSLRWIYVYMPDENHGTSLHNGAYKAFAFFSSE